MINENSKLNKNRYIILIFIIIAAAFIAVICYMIDKMAINVNSHNYIYIYEDDEEAMNIDYDFENDNNKDYNSKYKLNLVSAYGDNDAYHPKVVTFNEKWNGYKYWMSYTPFPESDATRENPHIVASNDLINWEMPNGFKNPLAEPSFKGKNRYYSDSHLTYNYDLDRLECYFRYVNDKYNRCVIYRMYTTDGINWSEKETVQVSEDRKNLDYISPAIIYEDGIYKIWYVTKKKYIVYAEADNNCMNWKTVREFYPEFPTKLLTWHLDVIKSDKGYEMIIVGIKNFKDRKTASLYYTYSEDNINWQKCTKILSPTKNTDNWDNRGIYRSSIIKLNGVYILYYSASGIDDVKGIGVMYGKDINNLNKLSIDYINDFNSAKIFNLLLRKEAMKEAK